jgi:hypothetical protein
MKGKGVIIRIPDLSGVSMWREAGLRRDEKGMVESAWRREQLELLRRREISWEDYFRAECPALWGR